VITSKQVAGAPGFAIWLRDWDLEPAAADALFRFEPPAEAQQIEFLKPAVEPGPAR
jgi:hypothetical protein